MLGLAHAAEISRRLADVAFADRRRASRCARSCSTCRGRNGSSRRPATSGTPIAVSTGDGAALARAARRTGRQREVAHGHHHRVGFDAIEADVEIARQSYARAVRSRTRPAPRRRRDPTARCAAPSAARLRRPSPRPRMRNAVAIPTTPGTFTVPLRAPFSCPPPSMTGSMRMPRRTIMPPMPFGPYSLCAENEARSTLVMSSGTLPAACVTSL